MRIASVENTGIRCGILSEGCCDVFHADRQRFFLGGDDVRGCVQTRECDIVEHDLCQVGASRQKIEMTVIQERVDAVHTAVSEHDIMGRLRIGRIDRRKVDHDADRVVTTLVLRQFIVFAADNGFAVRPDAGSVDVAVLDENVNAADAVVKTKEHVYVFEFKLDGSADDALKQIDEKGYLLPYSVDSRRLWKIGVSFDSKERNLGEWKIE